MRPFSRCTLSMTPALMCLLLANLLDGILTLTLLELRLVREVNPLMAQAYHLSPLAFMAFKTAIVYGALLAIAMVPRPTAKRWVVRFGALSYVSAVVYQAGLILRAAQLV